MTILSIENLTVVAENRHGVTPIVQNISFQIHAGETLALVGESGSGKTMTALALLDLLPPAMRRTAGRIEFKGTVACARPENGATRDDTPLAHLRGKRIAMIFQEPHAALNPVFRVGVQIADVIRAQFKFTSSAAKKRTLELLHDVGFAEPQRIYRAYPHQLSGGMAQRVMIAMALSCQPQLIIADEPTTSLDATIQLQILQLIKALQKEHDFACLLISHDIELVRAMADELLVMNAGQILERGATETVLDQPQHPYTRHLIDSVFEIPAVPDQSLVCPV